uniref:Piscidin 5 n=1 Tax=Dicentrarchus labrax TaxID=13489 RepID=A0A7L7S4B8_DICLA|nr:piscidin 5 [Dicentrarchus labrax]
MKCVMIFLVLTLVVLMAEPGEGLIGSLFRGAKAIFRGARQGWRAHKAVSRYRAGYVRRPVVYYHRVYPNDSAESVLFEDIV